MTSCQRGDDLVWVEAKSDLEAGENETSPNALWNEKLAGKKGTTRRECLRMI